MKIAFHDNYLCERGTSVALYDYAYYNRELLRNDSIILYDKTIKSNVESVVKKFKGEFKVFGYYDWSQVDSILKENSCDILYLIKGGEFDYKLSNVAKNVVHCVFNAGEPHGHVYSCISDSVRNYNGQPIVPHMINLPDEDGNLREILNIPKDAIVFGRYGGYEQFDIPQVQHIVYNVASNNPDIYFLFANTKEFCRPLKNIIHINKIIDVRKKVEFINSCDAMLWGRSDGETFGIAIGEFSYRNKPIIACKVGYQNHVKVLGDHGLWYDSSEELYNILTKFKSITMGISNWNCFHRYDPETVMNKFKAVYIDE